MDKKLKCGCVVDTLNVATTSFCKQHQDEHFEWVERLNLSAM